MQGSKEDQSTLIDIEKRVEINPSRPLDEVIHLVIQGLSKKHEATDALASWQFTKRSVNGKLIHFKLTESQLDGKSTYEFVGEDELGHICFYSYDYFSAFMHDEQEVEEAKNEIIKTELRLIFEVNTEETYDGLCHYYRSSLINADDSTNTCYGILDEFKRISTNEFLHFITEDK